MIQENLCHLTVENRKEALCGCAHGQKLDVASTLDLEQPLCPRCAAKLTTQQMNRLCCTDTSVGRAVRSWAYTVPAQH